MSKGQGLSAPEKTCTSLTGTSSTVGCCAEAVNGKKAATATATTTTPTCRPALIPSTLQRSPVAFNEVRTQEVPEVRHAAHGRCSHPSYGRCGRLLEVTSR